MNFDGTDKTSISQRSDYGDQSILLGLQRLLLKIKPYGFTLFIKRYGLEKLLDCLERNEQNGVVYHREGIVGDYDDFDDVEKLINFIKTGIR